MLFDVAFRVCSIRVWHGDPYYEPIIMVYDRKLIHWVTLTGKNNYCSKNCSPVMTPWKTVTVFSVAIHTSPRQPFLKMSKSCELYMAGCIIKRRIEWSLPEVHRTLYEEVINLTWICTEVTRILAKHHTLYLFTKCVCCFLALATSLALEGCLLYQIILNQFSTTFQMTI